jgi:DNA-binding MarR family transcriptional regulator
MPGVGKPATKTRSRDTVGGDLRLGPESELEPAVHAFRLILWLSQRLRYLMDDRLRADGLTTQQAALLTMVASLGRPSLREAAAAIRTTHQNVAQIVAALERKGLLRVEADLRDRRRRILVTTGANEEYWRNRNTADHAAVAEWFAVLSPEELRQFCALGTRLLGDLHGEPAPEPGS